MNTAPIVVSEMQGTGSLQIIQFLAVAKSQTRKTLERLPNRQVLPFDVAGRNVPRVRSAISDFYYRLTQGSGRVAASDIVLAVIAKYLYDLREIRLSREDVFDTLAVEVEAVCGQLEAVFFRNAIPQHRKKLVRCLSRPLPNGVCGNQFRVRIHGDENPSIPKLWGILRLYVTLLFSTETPDLISLDSSAAKSAQLFIHQLRAALTSENEEPEDGIAVHLRNALCAANARAFQQKLNCQQRFVFLNCHAAKQTRAAFSVGFGALTATKTPQTVALLPKLHAFDAASWAIHKSTVQQALAVCQGEIL